MLLTTALLSDAPTTAVFATEELLIVILSLAFKVFVDKTDSVAKPSAVLKGFKLVRSKDPLVTETSPPVLFTITCKI
jgi:hypothetical protein